MQSESKTELDQGLVLLPDNVQVGDDTIIDKPIKLIKKRKLGSGGFGKVYLVTDGENDYAVKRTLFHHKEGRNETYFMLSISEIAIIASCRDHPYIIKVLNVFMGDDNPISTPMSPLIRSQADDNLMLLMNVARGDLHDLYANKTGQYREFLLQHTKVIFTQIMLAIEYLHQHGICHRDIKPENVLVFWQDPTPENPNLPIESMYVQLNDFGMSKYLDMSNTIGVITPHYRAPEIAFGFKYYNYSVDIWSAGILLYFLITGEVLFKGGDQRDGYTYSLLKEINDMLPLETVTYADEKAFKFTASKKRQSVKTRLETWYNKRSKNIKTVWPYVLIEDKYMDLNDTTELLTAMLCLDYNRPTATELMKLPWFQNPTLDYLISEVHKIVEVPTPEPIYAPCLLKEADIARGFMIEFYNFYINKERVQRVRQPALSYRSFFLGLDLLDRCLASDGAILNQINYPRDSTDRVEMRILILVYCCYYIAYKFFHYNRMSIVEILEAKPALSANKKWINCLRKTEELVISCPQIGYIIYRPNLYEISKERSSNYINNIARVVTKMPSKYNGKLLKDIRDEMLAKR